MANNQPSAHGFSSQSASEVTRPDDEVIVVEDDHDLEEDFEDVYEEGQSALESVGEAPLPPPSDPMLGSDQDLETEDAARSTTPIMPLTDRVVNHRPSSRAGVSIGDDRPPILREDNPWDARDADRYLRAGLIPSVARAEGVDVLVLARRNGMYLWILLGECAGVVLLMLLICSAIINMPAKGIPSTAQIEVYRKVSQDKTVVTHFAEMVSARMETWSHWNAKSNPKKVTPYLDPGIRGIYENAFAKDTRDAEQFEERHIFEPVTVTYKGVKQETKHVVLVFYKAYLGRGKDERDFKLDRVSRRVKVLEVTEGPISAENEYGLFVLRHFDLTEAQWVDATNDNPWDRAEGVPEDVLKQKAKERLKAKEKAAKVASP